MGTFQVTGEPKTRHSAPGAAHKSQIEKWNNGPQPAACVFIEAAQDVVLNCSSPQGRVAGSCSTCPSGLSDRCTSRAVHTTQSTLPALFCRSMMAVSGLNSACYCVR